jgi:uncharacterized protein YggU (UPF0235/DUF167 family)
MSSPGRQKRSEIAGLHGDALKVRLAAPADRRSGECRPARVCRAAAGSAKSAVDLKSGQTSRRKVLLVSVLRRRQTRAAPARRVSGPPLPRSGDEAGRSALEDDASADQRHAHPAAQFVAQEGRVLALAAQASG